MALVKTEQAPGPVALRENQDRAVGEAQAEVGVTGVEISNRPVVAGLQASHVVAPCSEIAVEGTPSRFAETGAEQAVDLGGNRRAWRRGSLASANATKGAG